MSYLNFPYTVEGDNNAQFKADSWNQKQAHSFIQRGDISLYKQSRSHEMPEHLVKSQSLNFLTHTEAKSRKYEEALDKR